MASVKDRTERRKATVRRAIKLSAGSRARLSVFRSSKHIYAQVIDDRNGVTVASASLCGLPNMHAAFDLPIPNILHTDSPYHYREGLPGESPEQFATRMADNLEQLIVREGPDTNAAFMTEALQSTGGNIIPPPTYWTKI